jgi:hypothetical protein
MVFNKAVRILYLFCHQATGIVANHPLRLPSRPPDAESGANLRCRWGGHRHDCFLSGNRFDDRDGSKLPVSEYL